MFARGTLLANVHKNVVVIPVSALVPVASDITVASSEGTATGGTNLPPQQVYLLGPDNKAVARPVKTGIINGSRAEITSGLAPGDTLITVGQGQLRPGQAVKVENKADGGVGAGLATE